MGALTNAMRLQRRSSGPSSGTIEGVPAKTVVLLYTADLLEHVKSDGGVCFLRFSEVLITSDTTIFVCTVRFGRTLIYGSTYCIDYYCYLRSFFGLYDSSSEGGA